MSDSGNVPPPPPAGEPTAATGLWARYRHAPLWVQIAIPAAVIIVLVGVGLIIANAVGDESSTTSSTTTSTTAPDATDALLLAVSRQLVVSTTTTTTAATTTSEATTTTTEATTTTTEPATTTTATTAATTTTATAATTTTTTTTEPAATTTTTTTTTEPPTTTTSTPSGPTTTIQLPAGSVAPSRQAFQDAWNAAATNGVATISSWRPLLVAGVTASVADLGGNLRLAVASDTPTGPIAAAVLAWLPPDPSQVAAQNEAFRNAFTVLVKTVNPTATEAQQTTLATQLHLTPTTPPFPTGTDTTATLDPQKYRLEALVPEGQSDPDTLIAVSEIT